MFLLWIRRDFSTRSAVYVRAKWLDKDCIQLARMLKKKRPVFHQGVFAHPILWIFSGLSTVEASASAFLGGRSARYAAFFFLNRQPGSCSHSARKRQAFFACMEVCGKPGHGPGEPIRPRHARTGLSHSSVQQSCSIRWRQALPRESQQAGSPGAHCHCWRAHVRDFLPNNSAVGFSISRPVGSTVEESGKPARRFAIAVAGVREPATFCQTVQQSSIR